MHTRVYTSVLSVHRDHDAQQTQVDRLLCEECSILHSDTRLTYLVCRRSHNKDARVSEFMYPMATVYLRASDFSRATRRHQQSQRPKGYHQTARNAQSRSNGYDICMTISDKIDTVLCGGCDAWVHGQTCGIHHYCLFLLVIFCVSMFISLSCGAYLCFCNYMVSFHTTIASLETLLACL